jgi:hypothetical protein
MGLSYWVLAFGRTSPGVPVQQRTTLLSPGATGSSRIPFSCMGSCDHLRSQADHQPAVLVDLRLLTRHPRVCFVTIPTSMQECWPFAALGLCAWVCASAAVHAAMLACIRRRGDLPTVGPQGLSEQGCESRVCFRYVVTPSWHASLPAQNLVLVHGRIYTPRG